MADKKTGDAGVLNLAIAKVIEKFVRAARTIVPGKIEVVTRTLLGEVDVNFSPGIGTRKGGQEVGDGTVPNAGVAFPGGGGFSMRWPLLPQDEVIGMVADRNTERWRQTKIVGQAHSFSQRHHDLSDTVVFPFRLTPPTPTPPAAVTNETTDWVLQGPLGDIMRVSPTGPITIRKGPDGATAATITLDIAGSVTITVPTGQSVNVGGVAAVPLPKWPQLEAAIDALLTAGANIAVPTPPGTSGKVAFVAAQAAWELVKNTVATTKAKGE